jgi:guanyl-specific ribonuclease Sa
MKASTGKPAATKNNLLAWALIIGLIGLGFWLQYQEHKETNSRGDKPKVAEQETPTDPSDELSSSVKPIAPKSSPQEKPAEKSSSTKTDSPAKNAAQAKEATSAKTAAPTKPAPGNASESKTPPKSTGFTNPNDPKAVAKSNPANTKPVNPRAPPNSTTTKRAFFSNVTLRDQDGEVIYKGDIDLTKTLERIESGQRISRFPNDGSVFQNREGRLPRQSPGYYHEWVHPTPDERGPGPQRIVTGEDGDIWYTHDHYKTFRRVPN